MTGQEAYGEYTNVLNKIMEESVLSFDLIRTIISAQEATFIFVTNELGMGGVADNLLQRRFTDLQGWMCSHVAVSPNK